MTVVEVCSSSLFITPFKKKKKNPGKSAWLQRRQILYCCCSKSVREQGVKGDLREPRLRKKGRRLERRRAESCRGECCFFILPKSKHPRSKRLLSYRCGV